MERIGDNPSLGDLIKVMSEITTALAEEQDQKTGEVVADVRKVVLIGALLLGSVAQEPPSVILAALFVDATVAEMEQAERAAERIANQALWN